MPFLFTLYLDAQAVRLPPTQAALMCEEVRRELKRGVRNLYLSRKEARRIYRRCLRTQVYGLRL